MKNILFILFLSFFACTMSLYAQDDGFGDRHGIPRVAYFIDSIFVGTLLGINPESVDSLRLVKEPIEIDGKKYDGRMYFVYKKSAELLTLDQVRKKYIQKKTYSPIYLINHQFVKENVSQVKLDADYILRVNCLDSEEIDSFNKKNSIKFSLILIFTKTKENVERSETIYIRGSGDE